MTNTRTAVMWLTVAIVATASAATAQDQQDQPPSIHRLYVNVNGGAQPATRSFDITGSPTVYDEPAPFTASHHVGNGPLFDINGGYKIRNNVAVGVGFSSFSDKDNGSLVASIPHPIFFGQLRTATATAGDLSHSERAVYVQFVYTVPITDELDIAFGVGPAFIRVSQDLISSVSVPAGTQNADPVVGTETVTATGVIVGFDGSYMFTPRYGVGLFVRYSGASVDLPARPDLDVGGFQVGVGVRLRF